MRGNSTVARRLAAPVRTAGGTPRHRTHADGVADSEARDRYRALLRGLLPFGTLKRGTVGRWRQDDLSAGRRNPLADLAEHIGWAQRQRMAEGHAAADVSRDVDAILEQLAADLRAERARLAPAAPLPTLAECDLEETTAQAAADVAVRLYAVTPDDDPRKLDRLREARERTAHHCAAGRRLLDRLAAAQLARGPRRLSLVGA